MMPGVAAQPLRRQFSGGIDPSDVLAEIDFVAGTYAVHGVSVTAADIIDKPERIGASGLEILDNDPDGVVSAIGDFMTDLLGMDWTVVIEWDEQTTDGATYLLYFVDAGLSQNLVIERSTAFANLRVDVSETSFNSRYVENTTSHGPGIHTIAVTRTEDRISMACDGSDVASNVAAPLSMNPMASASFGGDPNDASYNPTFIRKVKVYNPLNDAFLPGLSA